MGLDTVEIVLNIEDAFQIQITDEEAISIETPQNLIDFVATKVELYEELIPLEKQILETLQQHFSQILGQPPNTFKPKTKLAQIIPQASAPHLWESLKTNIGTTDWPPLVRPLWVKFFLFFFSLTTFFYIIFSFKQNNATLTWGTLISYGFLAALGMNIIGLFITSPLKSTFPHYYSTIQDLIRFLLTKNPQLFKKNKKNQWTKEQITLVVREIISEQTGIKDFSNQDHFIRDLKLD